MNKGGIKKGSKGAGGEVHSLTLCGPGRAHWKDNNQTKMSVRTGK